MRNIVRSLGPAAATGAVSVVAIVVVVVLVAAGAGCTAPRPPLVVKDPDPSVKIPAIKKAVRERDRSAVSQLVKDLESDDPAVRFYAISGLQRLTGKDFDYRYFEPDEQRKAAVQRWREWLDAWKREDGPPGPQSGIAGGGRDRRPIGPDAREVASERVRLSAGE